MSNETITFSARFGGVSRDIYVPLNAVMGIYARENGQGLFFDPNEYEDIQITEETLKSTTLSEETEQPKTKKKPSLRLLD
jgi:stringent starvation protein B